MATLIYICFVLFALIYLIQSKDTKCALPKLLLNHYEEWNCTAVVKDDCPIRYECPDVKEQDPKKCYVNGKVYDSGQQILEDDHMIPCMNDCSCNILSKIASVECAEIDCPEFYELPPSPECIRQVERDKCCSSKLICDGEEIAKLATCEYDGTTYRGGELIDTKLHPCYSCICGDGFDANNIENSVHCVKVNCGGGIKQDKLREGCSPIYYGTERCCNIGWRCPNGNRDAIAISQDLIGIVDEQNSCRFGNLTLSIGDTLNEGVHLSYKQECKCWVPPLPLCIRTSKFNN